MITVDQWAGDLLRELGAPSLPASRRFLAAWALGENTKARFNPLATTWSMSGDSFFNTFGDRGQYHVRNYASYADGLAATARTLRDGYYPTILTELHSGRISITSSSAVHRELNTWGTGGDNVFRNLGAGEPALDWQPPSLVAVHEPPAPSPVDPPAPAPRQLPKESSMVIVVSKEHGTGYSVENGVWTEIDDANDLSNAINALPHFEWSTATIVKVRGH